MRFPAKITSNRLHSGLPYACGGDGRSVGRAYGHVITKISRMGRLPNFLTHGAPLRARGSANIFTTLAG